MLENAQSPLIKTVSEADLLAIVRASLDRNMDIIEYRQLKGGLFNTAYYINTRNPQRDIILRIAPPSEMHGTLFNYEKTMMQSEPAIYDLMRANGLPVPEVIALDATGAVIPRQFILLQYLDTITMNDPSVPDAEKPALQHQLGATLKQMHSITHQKFGRVRPDGTVDGSASWHIVFSEFFAEAVQRCREHHLIDATILAHVEEGFAKHVSALDDPTIQPALVHGDLWGGNVLVTSDPWRIVAIIDVDRAMFADAEFDAALWYNTPDFLAGYGTRKTDSDAAKRRFTLYHLYQDLFHLFVFGVQIPIPDSMKLHHDNIIKLAQTL